MSLIIVRRNGKEVLDLVSVKQSQTIPSLTIPAQKELKWNGERKISSIPSRIPTWHLFRRDLRVNIAHLSNAKQQTLSDYVEKIQGYTPLCDARGLLALFSKTLIPLKKTSVICKDDYESWIKEVNSLFPARVHGFVVVFYKRKLGKVEEYLLKKCLEIKTEQGWKRYD